MTPASETPLVPPGPKGSLLFGNLREIRKDPLAFLLRAREVYGDVVRIRIAHLAIYLLNDPGDIESVLVTDQRRFAKGRTLERARRLFGNGLLTSDGEFHDSQRRQILPGFQRARLAAYFETMSNVAREHRDRLHSGESLDLARAMSRLTLAIAGRTLFGVDLESLASDLDEAQAAGIGRLEMMLLPLPRTRRFRAARARVDRTLYELIDARRRDGDGGDDLLSQWSQAGTGAMTDVQIRDEMITLLLGGYETTANTLAWTWCLLAQHPQVEARFHAELDSILGSRQCTSHDVASLPLTRMILAESLRLYPPAWLIGRVAVEDHDAGGYRLPAGSLVIMSSWAAHRDVRYFRSPEEFDPDRWRPERQNGRPRFSYFPFGGGSRGCIGEQFALTESALVLATLGQRWRFRLVGSSPGIDPSITLRPSGGLHVRVEARS